MCERSILNGIEIEEVLEKINSIAYEIESLLDYDLITYPFFDSDLKTKAEPTTFMVNQLLTVYAVLEFIESPILEVGRLVFDNESEKYTIEGTHYSYSYNHLVEFWDSNVKSFKLAKIAYHIKNRYVAVTLDNMNRMILLDGLKVRYRGISKIKDVMCTSSLQQGAEDVK